ncbi:MAG: ATP-binding protein, partial [Phycisphaerae bacterium]|nr:ATP-binding protein [Phycisphaerae bacterium]
KAAIRAGIRLLQQQAGMDDSRIDQVLLAGAFGNYIRRESALRIGLLPDIRVEKIHFVGNAASAGAQMALVSRQARTIASLLARQIEYIEIAHQPVFQSVFTDCLMFP